jgi:hypothetical protein
VDIEPPGATKTKETPEEKLAQWKLEILGSAATLHVEPDSEGVKEEAIGEKYELSDAARQQAEDKFEQTLGLSHECRQSLTLLRGAGVGPATKINGLFHWDADDSLILHKVAKAVGLASHGRKKDVYILYMGEVKSSCAYWVPLED